LLLGVLKGPESAKVVGCEPAGAPQDLVRPKTGAHSSPKNTIYRRGFQIREGEKVVTNIMLLRFRQIYCSLVQLSVCNNIIAQLFYICKEIAAIFHT
jgi:hypothetical protein